MEFARMENGFYEKLVQSAGRKSPAGIEIVCAGVTIDERRDHKRLAEERRRRAPPKKNGARRRSGEL